MSAETRICQNCKIQFTIEPEDLDLYLKIDVPSPTFCFQCRITQLMIWRNERSLYKRQDAFGKNLISIYAPEKEMVVYSQLDWWADNWDPLTYGQEYSFELNFFEQFSSLLRKVPLPNLFNQRAVNSEYCNHTEDSKDCHLTFASIWNERVSYSSGAVRCRDSQDILHGENLELCYDVIDCEECYHLISSRQCVSCTGSAFLLDCKSCMNCFGCVGLRNKSYCILNKQYSKEEYLKKLNEILGNRRAMSEFQEQAKKLFAKFPRRYANLINTQNVIGDQVSNAKNCYYCFSIYKDTENCRYCVHGGAGLKDTSDSYGMGAGELMYKVIDTGIQSSRLICMIVGRGGHNASYSFYCHNSDNIFGCVGLRSKKYCILNKQYAKEEYEKLLPQIIKHMDREPYKGKNDRVYKYGDFFPSEISPFAYNETIAQEYFPLTKERAIQQGFIWKNFDAKNYAITKTPEGLSDHIQDTDDSLLNETIGCLHRGQCNQQCTTAFKLIPQELQFYRRLNIPVPQLCPNCRHYERLAQRNPLKLWHGHCQCVGKNSENQVYQNTNSHFHDNAACPNEFETSYAPNRPEIVYCEQCYQAEVA